SQNEFDKPAAKRHSPPPPNPPRRHSRDRQSSSSAWPDAPPAPKPSAAPLPSQETRRFGAPPPPPKKAPLLKSAIFPSSGSDSGRDDQFGDDKYRRRAERKKEQKALERRHRDLEEASNPPYARFRVRAFSTAPATLSNDAREAMIPASYGMKEDQTTYWFFNENKEAREYAARGSRVLSQNLHDDLNLKRTETTVAFNARARNEADLHKMGIKRALDPKDFEADSDALVAATGDKPRFHEIVREMAIMPERIPDGLGQMKTMIKRYYPTMPAAEIYNHVMNALYIQFTDDRYINGLAEQTRRVSRAFIDAIDAMKYQWVDNDEQFMPTRAFPAWGLYAEDQRIFR
ncbi:unnamed protein product, partial [Oikopleura dioica]